MALGSSIISGISGGATIAIVIKGVDQYSKEFKNAQSSLEKFSSLAKTAGLVATTAFAAFTVSAIKAGAAMIPMENSFKKLTKESDNFLKSLNDATKGTISDFELMSNANKALLLGLDQEALPKLFENAAIVGRAAGRTTSEAIEDITLGIGRQSRLILDNLGIIIKSGDVYEEYAQSIGKSTSELTAQEKQMAFNQAAMQALQESANNLGGLIPEDAITNAQRLNKALQDVKVAFGEGFIQNISSAIPKAEGEWSQMGKTVGEVLGLIVTGSVAALKIYQVAILGITGALTLTITGVAKLIESVINGIIWGINRVIDGINKIRSFWGGDTIDSIGDVNFTSRLDKSLLSQATKTSDLIKDINELTMNMNSSFKNLGKASEPITDTASAVKELSKEQKLVDQLSGFKLITQTGDIFNPNSFQKSEFQSDFAYEQAKRGGGIEINIENINGMDPDEIANALNNILSNKISL